METLKKCKLALMTLLCIGSTTAFAADIKIGIVAPFSGPWAYMGQQIKTSAEAYVASHGGKLGGRTVELIYRDTTGPNPSGSKSIVQELIVKDKVDYLGGFVMTPNAMAIAPLIQEAKVPTVIFVATGLEITKKSDYFIRTGHTTAQVGTPLARQVYAQGIRKMVTAVVDYSPGVDAENAFKNEFTRMGGTVVEAIRMPLRTTDFTPFAQRIKASGAQGVFVFLAGGPPNLGFVKSYAENGLRAAGIEFFGTVETDEHLLQQFGEQAIGLTTANFYSEAHDSTVNRNFISALQKQEKGAVANFVSVGAWDGMYVISKMIEATGGQKDSDKAIAITKMLSWESPRGPVKIDADSRHITQNVYLRKVERAQTGLLVNKEFKNLGAQIETGYTK
jgi:branched-chain amino acid transport system substrate-binding protein